MTEKEKNKYRLIYKLQGHITFEEAFHNSCSLCQRFSSGEKCTGIEKTEFLSFCVSDCLSEIDKMIECFCLDFIEKKK